MQTTRICKSALEERGRPSPATTATLLVVLALLASRGGGHLEEELGGGIWRTQRCRSVQELRGTIERRDGSVGDK